jgi:ATP-dependent helicase/DNAse subunit B
LRRHHPHLEIRRLEPRASTWVAIDHLAQNIFRHPADVAPPAAEVLESLSRLEIVGAAGAQEEIVEIARRIKQRLTTGESCPGDILVIFRSLGDVAPRVREVFEQSAIPYYVETSPRLMTSSIVKTLLSLLRLETEDWPFRGVISVITNRTLRAFDELARFAADWLVRDLQIAAGRQTLLDLVDRLATDSIEPSGRHAEERVAKARAARPLLYQLVEVLDNLPQEATPTAWFAALADAGVALGLIAHRTDISVHHLRKVTADGHECPSYDEIDLASWQATEQYFALLEALDTWLGQPPRLWSRLDLISAIVDVASHEPLPQPHDEVGRVRIHSAPTARNLSARHVYLAGMSEQAFPAPEPAGRLAAESDYRFAAHVADQELVDSPEAGTTRSQDEMLLFYEVLTRADESLTISYPALDDKAQSLPPSPYVLEIERTLGSKGWQRVRRPKTQLLPMHVAASAATDAQDPEKLAVVSSLVDWRTRAVAEALSGDCHLLAGIFTQLPPTTLANALDAGIRIVHARARGDSFGPAEGMLIGTAAVRRLTERFGSQHLWSPSQWETYAACPYKFLLKEVLGLAPLGELVLETDFARRGSRLHRVMADFYRQWPAVCAESALAVDEESAAFVNHLRRVIDEAIVATPRAGIDAALLELDRRQISKWAGRHFDHQQKYVGACAKLGGALAPAHFEFRFGPPRADDVGSDPSSTPDAFVIEVNGEPIRVTGQIDRIDVGSIHGKTFFNVIDYKSGKKTSFKPEHIESGERLQLPIYVEAAQMLLFRGAAKPLAAGYWSMSAGFDAKGALASGGHPARRFPRRQPR